MAKPIIGGPDTSKPQVARASNGGQMTAKTLPYSTPQGPKGQMHKGPGLGDYNYGNIQKPVCHGSSGSPGIGGSNKGVGSQR